MGQGLRWAAICAMVLMIACCIPAGAVSVSFTVDPLGGNMFLYDFVVDNTGGTEPVAGLFILKGNSVFGLNSLSFILAPQDVGGNPAADWMYFAPGPPLIDSLDYFSLISAGDVPIGGSLSGFIFKSVTDPAGLTSAELPVILVGGISGAQTPYTAQYVPEPGTLTCLAMGLCGLLVLSRRLAGERSRPAITMTVHGLTGSATPFTTRRLKTGYSPMPAGRFARPGIHTARYFGLSRIRFCTPRRLPARLSRSHFGLTPFERSTIHRTIHREWPQFSRQGGLMLPAVLALRGFILLTLGVFLFQSMKQQGHLLAEETVR